MRRCAVIGYPAQHSLSPALHRAAYRELGLDWDYQAIDVVPGGVAGFIASLDESWRGLSVTMPHKAAICAFGTPDDVVRLVGVGNTLLLDEPRSVHNTDVSGLVRALGWHGVDQVGRATMVGAGATARSALVALHQLGLTDLNVLVRDPQRATDLKALASHLRVRVRVDVLGTVDARGEIIICTLPGEAADPFLDTLLAPAATVLDVSYAPWPSALASAAMQSAITVISGLDLLVGQAVDQVRLMTGSDVDPAVLLSAGQEVLGRRRAD